MVISYSDKPPIIEGKKRLFLAGPTIRKEDEKSWKENSWRKEAISVLGELNFDGIVYVPEYEKMRKFIEKDEQFFWEWDALHASDLIIFWVPRVFPKLPGMSTNVEFGFYITQKPVLYGRPDDADKIEYLDRLYKKVLNKKPINSLKELMTQAVIFLNTK